MSQQPWSPPPWGPVIERKPSMPRLNRPSTLAAPFDRRRRHRRATMMGNPSVAVDLLAVAFLLSLAFLLWLAS